MKRRGNPALLGLFVLAGLALVFVTLFTVAGGDLFARKERAVMYFGGSIYGLQVGAPVVFRGVRLGSVTTIGLAQDKARGDVAIPVVAEMDLAMIRNIQGSGPADDPSRGLKALVERGLRAELAMQSLLTNQLYIDLDFQPDKAATTVAIERSETQIPTVATAIQELRAQIDGINVRQLLDDVATIASSARKVVSGPELSQALADVAIVSANLRHITERLDRRVDPLADATRDTLAGTRQAMAELGQAAQRVGDSASRVGDTATRLGDSAERVSGALGADAPLLQSLRGASDELARSAAALRNATQEDAQLMQNVQRALQDVARASRAVRELADTLDAQPESLLKGRR